jgi:hypothetical protein
LHAKGVVAHTSADVVALVRSGNLEAGQAIRQAGRTIGEVLAACVSMVTPSLIVVVGDLAAAGEMLLTRVREAVYRCSLPLATENLRIVPSRAGQEAGVLGASCRRPGPHGDPPRLRPTSGRPLPRRARRCADGLVRTAGLEVDPLESMGRGRVRGECRHDGQGSPAGPDVQVDQFAGPGRVAPDAEDVVDQLESNPQVHTEPPAVFSGGGASSGREPTELTGRAQEGTGFPRHGGPERHPGAGMVPSGLVAVHDAVVQE